jgi:hypothetical protein
LVAKLKKKEKVSRNIINKKDGTKSTRNCQEVVEHTVDFCAFWREVPAYAWLELKVEID